MLEGKIWTQAPDPWAWVSNQYLSTAFHLQAG